MPPESPNTKNQTESEESHGARWLQWGTVLALLGSLAYGAAYITGVAFNQARLSALHVPADMFPRQGSDFLVFAYEAWLQLWPIFFDLAGESKTYGLIFLCGLDMFLWSQALGRLRSSNAGAWLKEKLPHNAKVLFCSELIFYVLFWLFLVIILPVWFGSVPVLPAWAGNVAGKRAAQKEISNYAIPCNQAKDNQRCFAVTEGTNVVAVGHMVEASDKLIALKTAEGVRILSLSGRSVEEVVTKP